VNALPPPLDPAALGLVRPDAAGLGALAAVVDRHVLKRMEGRG